MLQQALQRHTTSMKLNRLKKFVSRTPIWLVQIFNKIAISYYRQRTVPIPVAERSKASVCGRSLAEIAGSNTAGDMDVCCECCVISGKDLCDGPIPRPEKPYRLWCVFVCDLETSRMRRLWPALGCCARRKERQRAITYSCKPNV